MSQPDLSVVFPVYNEEENVPILLEEIAKALAGRPWTYEIVAVDDGSADRSLQVLRDLRTTYPSLRILTFEKNSGQTAALDAAWRAARGTFVVSLDADLQNDPADIPAMMKRLEESGVDMVIEDRQWCSQLDHTRPGHRHGLLAQAREARGHRPRASLHRHAPLPADARPDAGLQSDRDARQPSRPPLRHLEIRGDESRLPRPGRLPCRPLDVNATAQVQSKGRVRSRRVKSEECVQLLICTS